jgi:hypothetical protein
MPRLSYVRGTPLSRRKDKKTKANRNKLLYFKILFLKVLLIEKLQILLHGTVLSVQNKFSH